MTYHRIASSLMACAGASLLFGGETFDVQIAGAFIWASAAIRAWREWNNA